MNTNSPDFDGRGSDRPGLDKPVVGEFDKSGWIAQARRLLDESADGLDAAALSRLNRARQAALEPRQRRSARQPWLLPAGLAGACAMLLVVAIWTPHHAAPAAGDAGHSASASTANEATDALGGDDSVEFYQDLDFYAWLDAQGKDGSG